MRKSIFTAALFVATLPLTYSAQAEAIKTPAGLQAPLQAGFKVEKSFQAASGLTGWVLQDTDGQYNVFYTTPDGQAMIAGALVSATGENLTQKYAETHIPKPDLSALYAKFEKSAYVAGGELKNPKSIIYAVFDPNCVFCHYLYLALKPYEKAGLQVRYVPVGFLHEDSANKAAQLLAEGAKALDAQQAAYNTPEMPKGIAVTPEMKAKLEANQALMREAQMNGTPGILYKDANGNVLKKDGMPMLAELPAITGLPEQPQTDARLSHFK
jgi:thiol:disulfide interchange protein DsbG